MEYGGQPPPGWDPAGGPHAGQWPGYGPPGVAPEPLENRASVLLPMICNVGSVMVIGNYFAIPGGVTSVIAMRKCRTDPAAVRKYVIWSWILFGISVVLYIGTIVLIILLIIMAAPESAPSSTI